MHWQLTEAAACTTHAGWPAPPVAVLITMLLAAVGLYAIGYWISGKYEEVARIFRS